MLVQHQTIMTLGDEQAFEDVRKFGNLTREEMEEGLIPEAIYITKKNWEDMGSPEIITVTVNPGDILNNTPKEGDSNG